MQKARLKRRAFFALPKFSKKTFGGSVPKEVVNRPAPHARDNNLAKKFSILKGGLSWKHRNPPKQLGVVALYHVRQHSALRILV